MFWALSNRLICTFQSTILRWCFWSYCSRWHMADDYLRGFAKFFIYFIKFTYQGNFQTFIKWSSKQLINLVLIIFFIELLLAKKISLLRLKKKKTVWLHSFIICIIGFKILLWVIFLFSCYSRFSLTRDNNMQNFLKLQSNKIMF